MKIVEQNNRVQYGIGYLACENSCSSTWYHTILFRCVFYLPSSTILALFLIWLSVLAFIGRYFLLFTALCICGPTDCVPFTFYVLHSTRAAREFLLLVSLQQNITPVSTDLF